jgi:hypothetical protein
VKSPEPSTFEEAVASFESLLRENGYVANLIWAEPRDLILSGRRRIYVRLPVSATNLDCVRERFTSGMSTGRGITFGTICKLQHATCCYAWTPATETERETHLMSSGLKLSVGVDQSRFTGSTIKSWSRWQLLKIRYRRYSTLKKQLFG